MSIISANCRITHTPDFPRSLPSDDGMHDPQSPAGLWPCGHRSKLQIDTRNVLFMMPRRHQKMGSCPADRQEPSERTLSHIVSSSAQHNSTVPDQSTYRQQNQQFMQVLPEPNLPPICKTRYLTTKSVVCKSGLHSLPVRPESQGF